MVRIRESRGRTTRPGRARPNPASATRPRPIAQLVAATAATAAPDDLGMAAHRSRRRRVDVVHAKRASSALLQPPVNATPMELVATWQLSEELVFVEVAQANRARGLTPALC